MREREIRRERQRGNDIEDEKGKERGERSKVKREGESRKERKEE